MNSNFHKLISKAYCQSRQRRKSDRRNSKGMRFGYYWKRFSSDGYCYWSFKYLSFDFSATHRNSSRKDCWWMEFMGISKTSTQDEKLKQKDIFFCCTNVTVLQKKKKCNCELQKSREWMRCRAVSKHLQRKGIVVSTKTLIVWSRKYGYGAQAFNWIERCGWKEGKERYDESIKREELLYIKHEDSDEEKPGKKRKKEKKLKKIKKEHNIKVEAEAENLQQSFYHHDRNNQLSSNLKTQSQDFPQEKKNVETNQNVVVSGQKIKIKQEPVWRHFWHDQYIL